jgi:hypothetical protein
MNVACWIFDGHSPKVDVVSTFCREKLKSNSKSATFVCRKKLPTSRDQPYPDRLSTTYVTLEVENQLEMKSISGQYSVDGYSLLDVVYSTDIQ